MKTTKQITAIEKLRIISNWSAYEYEDINLKFKSIRDIEKAYDFCEKMGVEFVSNLEDADRGKLSNKLGYTI